jgi:hypothetical protein
MESDMSRARIRTIVRQFAQNGMKLLLENPHNVRDLLSIPELEIVKQIDFDHMTRLHTTFVQPDYRHLEADVVLRAPLTGQGKQGKKQAITIYILIEHQSEPNPIMAFRVLEYLVQIYKAQAREWSRREGSFIGLRLHPVLPVVFYTGSQRWESVGRLENLIEAGERFAAMIPRLDPLFLNLSNLPAKKLETAGGFGWVLRLVQERQKRREEFQALLPRVIQGLEKMPATERMRWLELLSYIQALVYHERNPAEHSSLRQEIETSVQTDQLRQEVFAMEKTIASELQRKGRKEGEIRARRHILLDQLRERFGALPEATVAAITSSKNIQELNTWLRRFAKAETLEEIGIER